MCRIASAVGDNARRIRAVRSRPYTSAGLLRQFSVVLTLALLVLWIASMLVRVGVREAGWIVLLQRGCVYVWTQPATADAGWGFAWQPSAPRWLPNAFPGMTARGSAVWRGWLPLWIPLVLVATPTGFSLWLARRPRGPGRCAGCGYDLTGNQSGHCPECGRRVHPRAVGSTPHSPV
jgi:hypothetical protein